MRRVPISSNVLTVLPVISRSSESYLGRIRYSRSISETAFPKNNARRMGPDRPLPYSNHFSNTEEYIDSLLQFYTSSPLLQKLCGGMHNTEFFISSPDVYSATIPEDWRVWFRKREITDILDLLVREELDVFDQIHTSPQQTWRGGPAPPSSFLQYVIDVRRHALDRSFHIDNGLPINGSFHRRIAVGMNRKKAHEVFHFAQYVDKLSADVSSEAQRPITHLVDIGCGLNYLGRTLACRPFNKHVIGIEGRAHNVEASRNMDVTAKLAPKAKIIRNKKEWRKKRTEAWRLGIPMPVPDPPSNVQVSHEGHARDVVDTPAHTIRAASKEDSLEEQGTVQYVSQTMHDGDLKAVIAQVAIRPSSDSSASIVGDCSLMVISLHSCGNLLHHGLRALSLNPAVKAVALIGCCYNLMTERLGPTFKHPSLRPQTADLLQEGSVHDQHGFPLSKRFMTYKPHLDDTGQPNDPDREGVRINIRARSMAVQAPSNWSRDESTEFFKRHFYRALLQRVLADHKIVSPVANPSSAQPGGSAGLRDVDRAAPLQSDKADTSLLVVGSIPKQKLATFASYAQHAVAKLLRTDTSGPFASPSPATRQRLTELAKLSADDFTAYEDAYRHRQHEIAILWSLMAFSATVVESMIVVDRWLFLAEMEDVGPQRAWVQAVWDYEKSPRNLVVVGVKK